MITKSSKQKRKAGKTGNAFLIKHPHAVIATGRCMGMSDDEILKTFKNGLKGFMAVIKELEAQNRKKKSHE